MEHYIGLDVSLELTSICVIDGTGKTLWEGKCASTPEAIAAIINTRAPRPGRVGRNRCERATEFRIDFWRRVPAAASSNPGLLE